MRFESLVQDTRFALRSLFRSPAFTIVAVLSLALGIGANISIFSIADALLFRPMAVPAGERLIRAYYGNHSPFSYADFRDIREQVKTSVNLAAVRATQVSLGERDAPHGAVAELATDNYFQTLGLTLQLGRPFSVQETNEGGAHKVAILSERLWKRSFNAASDVVGQAILINGSRYEIIGVAPEKFQGTLAGQVPELWLPMSEAPTIVGLSMTERSVGGGLYTIGQLTPTTTIEQANASFALAAASLKNQFPKIHANLTIATDRASGVPAEVWPALAVAGGGLQLLVALVMLIACSNVVNVVLARATIRKRELAVRAALGASRKRIVQQLFTESLLLAAAAAGAGLLISTWALRIGFSALPTDFPLSAPDTSVTLRVFLFALGLSLIALLLCGLWPALRTSRVAAAPALRESGGSADPHQSRLRNVLLVAQVSMCTVLLVGSGLFLRSLWSASVIRPGFDVEHVVDVPVDLRQLGLDETRGRAFLSTLGERVAATPGVERVTMAALVPLSFDNMGMSFSIEGRTPTPGGDMPEAGFNIVDTDYFGTLGIDVVRGRVISREDLKSSPMIVVINETMARTYWPNADAIGQRLGANVWGSAATVVGIVRDSKYTSLGEEPKPFMYLSFSQHYSTHIVMQIRTKGDPRSLLASTRSTLNSLAPNAITSGIHTLSDDVRVALLPAKAGATMLGAFGALALALAMGGVFGVVSFTVAQRTREIGIRSALGGRATDIVRFVMTGSLKTIGVGLAIGLTLALGAGQLMSTFLYGVSAADPVTFVAVPFGFALVAAIACVGPVRRAVRVDPLTAIRQE